MAKLTLEELKKKYNEKIVDNDDLVIELMEDLTDSFEVSKDIEELKALIDEKDKEISELKEKYNPVIVTERDDYNIEEIIKYAKHLPSINPHSVNPVYLKLPEAMEKNDKRSN